MPTTTTALIVIDVQRALFEPAPRPADADDVIARINLLARRARASGAPCVWVQHERPGTPLAADSEGWQLDAALEVADGDLRIRKTTPDSFLRTALADRLAALGVREVVIAGYSSEFCVDTTVRRAAALGFAVTLAADAHTSHDKPHASGAQIRAHENATLPAITSFGPPIRALPTEAIDFGAAAVDPSRADDDHRVRSLAQLLSLYGQPAETSIVKETTALTPAYRAIVEASPLAIIATAGTEGLDASPRGDPAPVLAVLDDSTLLLPDRRGNQRIDSLRNLVDDPRIALLLLVPGTDETLRIQGRATLGTDPALRQRFAVDGKLPTTVAVIRIERVYFQCARALMRSKLWEPAGWPARGTVPTAGRMLADASAGRLGGEAHDAAAPQRLRDGMY